MFGLFKKKAPQAAKADFDYDFVSVDMHSHVLPGIDDGAQTVEDSVVLIKEMMALGIKKIIATPHIMADYFRNNAQTINDALIKLNNHLRNENIDITVEAAAEHYFDEYFLKLIETDSLMLIKDKYVLFELAFTAKPPNLINTVQKITDKGLTPILAHPERYPYLTIEEVEMMRNWGCRIQLNTISLTGYYGKEVKAAADALVDAGLIDFISSDMHHPRHAQALKVALQTSGLKKLKDSGNLQNISLL
ncbi:tyrosine-protein phosphatase [Mucilaginibacter aquatilis]|uniref:protein-tyrosine-phosphatase n=1 Tax=Mucilaginibacter aquatilis TaxID=1517760 RepID=A0A6I4I7Q0_9SPHI|nr:CpsB/CapC family capsule biosynthesis tyrosine phosphatase [Mucilaginibacter aquatilis]MVN90927.1 capsular biosynthesis protein [Mucilaginibacter aquatilis]